jgi:hypothetical protein
MEIFGLILGLCGLGVLAIRFGRDSRATLESEEQRLASLGLAWDGKPSATRRNARANGVVRIGEATPPPSFVVAHPFRHRLAAGLYRLADWLYPGVSEPRRSTSM